MFQMDPNSRPLHPSLQAKLQLLQNIQKGNIQRVRQLAYALSKVGRTNPQLYGKLSQFVQTHKQQLKDIDSQDEQQQAQIINVEDDFVQAKQWDSDESVDWQSDQQDEQKQNMMMRKVQTKQNLTRQPSQKKELFKQIKNTNQRRSVSNKKKPTTTNNTYQFKQSIVNATKKTSDLKPSNSKAQLHRNSAIGKSKVCLQQH